MEKFLFLRNLFNFKNLELFSEKSVWPLDFFKSCLHVYSLWENWLKYLERDSSRVIKTLAPSGTDFRVGGGTWVEIWSRTIKSTFFEKKTLIFYLKILKKIDQKYFRNLFEDFGKNWPKNISEIYLIIKKKMIFLFFQESYWIRVTR